ncbi:MAG: CotH kinase family protein, partial [Oscillospiraceae bacterium]|nr:CotH kinase family protein [Oscillospiraceae bacterium]
GQMPDGMQMPADGHTPGGMTGGRDGSAGGVSLEYSDDEISSYSNIFDNSITRTDDEDHKRVIEAIKGISESDDPEKYIDVDEVLRYTAANVFLVNLDSYFSSMAHNYCLAENNTVLSMIPWDYNLSFGSFQSHDSSSVINYAVDTVFDGVTADARPIIGKLLEKEENMETYHKYLRQIAEEYVQGGVFEKKINDLTSVIDEYVKNDDSSFNGYDAFTKGVDALKTFGTLRAQSILGQLDGAIPATQDEQKDSDALIDASSLDMSLLGTMDMGNKMGAEGQTGRPDRNFNDNKFNKKQETAAGTTTTQTTA